MSITVRELRDRLAKWADQDQPIAYSIWCWEDAELIAGDLVGEPDPKEVWAKVVDELQQDFDEGYLVEKISENMYGYVYDHYETS